MMVERTRGLGYRNPEDSGRIRKRFNLSETSKFTLMDQHKSVCSSPLCLAMYQNAHDYEKNKKYAMIPLYKNNETDVKQCYLCLNIN